MRNVNIPFFHIRVLLDNIIVSVEWKGQGDGQEGSSPLNVRGYRTKESFGNWMVLTIFPQSYYSHEISLLLILAVLKLCDPLIWQHTWCYTEYFAFCHLLYMENCNFT